MTLEWRPVTMWGKRGHMYNVGAGCFVSPAFACGGQRLQQAKGFGFSNSRPLIYAD